MLLFATASTRSLVAIGLYAIDTVVPRTAVALPGDGTIRCVVPVHAMLPPNRIAR